MKFRYLLVALLASFGLIGTLGASPAQAAASYGTYKYEGSYPTAVPCNGSFYQPSSRPTKSVTYKGYNMRLKYYYHGSCGSFARIEGAPSGKCWAYLDRSDDGGRTWAYVNEPVDAGINYAYTKMGNNLNGRLSRAALVCNFDGGAREVVLRTSWY